MIKVRKTCNSALALIFDCDQILKAILNDENIIKDIIVYKGIKNCSVQQRNKNFRQLISRTVPDKYKMELILYLFVFRKK